jgi:putative phage-type endonuclease
MQTDTVSLPAGQFQTFADRPSWLEGRRTLGIGSSDAAAILGVSRFKSPLALYYEKLGIRQENPKTSERREWGLILEEPIARRYESQTGRYVVPAPAFSVARSTKYPFAVASCDRFVVGHRENAVPTPPGIGITEIKNADFFIADQWSEDNNNEPPIEYQIQLQHQLMVTGLLWGSIAALIGGNSFLWADRKRDEALIAVLAEREAEFWRRVELRDPPPADGSEATKDVLRLVYPKDTGEVVTLGPESIDWHERLTAAKLAKAAAKLDEDTYSNLLRQAIGDATAGVLPNGKVYTHKLQGRAEFVTKATEFRVLRLKGGDARPKSARTRVMGSLEDAPERL